MKNRKLILIVSLVLALTMSLGGTLAYLTDTDADVNTMVLGNVSIEQNEQEWNADKTVLKEFTQDKPLLPYVGELGWENKEDQGGAYRRFTMNNVVDKYVTVTNTGNTNAYVRTIIALEMGDYTYEEFKMIGASVNAANGSEFKFPGAWVWTDDYAAQIDGTNYNIMVAVHQDPLAAKETTIPSLLQVYLSKDADNEDVQKLDGNKNGKYDILVISQAVQADGFSSAAEALETGFGEATVANVQSWFGGLEIPTNVATAEELAAALAEGGTVVLTADITTDTITIKNGKEATINLNGKTLTATAKSEDRTNYALDNYGTLTLTGNGTIEARGVENFGTMIVEDGVKIVSKDANGGSAIWNEGGHLTINGGIFTTANLTANEKGPAALTNNGGTVVVNNGTFDGESPRCYAVLNNGGKMTINNATVTGKHGAVGVTGGEVIINGGNFHLVGVAGQSDHNIYAEGGNVTVNGGKFTADEAGLDAGGKIFYGSVTDNSNN